MTLSNSLFQIAGFFEGYRRTGGTITAVEAVELAGKLTMLGEGVASLEAAQKSLADEFDRYIEDMSHEPRHTVARPRGVRDFAVIDGALA